MNISVDKKLIHEQCLSVHDYEEESCAHFVAPHDSGQRRERVSGLSRGSRQYFGLTHIQMRKPCDHKVHLALRTANDIPEPFVDVSKWIESLSKCYRLRKSIG